MSFGNVFWWFSQKNQKLFENNKASDTQCFNCSYLDKNQYFIQISRIVNFTKAIENQGFIFHNVFVHPDSLFTSIARDMRNTVNKQKHAFYLSNKI